jgi:hypothetical protein
MSKNILAIGTSGLGKTTFCRLLCDVNVDGLDGSESATEKIEIHEGNGFCYIDTPGFNDSHGRTDEETFHEILRLFQKNSRNNQFQVDAVLWFCEESIRELEHFQKQAKFIQRFIEYTDDRPEDLWKSVIIVIKANRSAKGPESAARKICKTFAEERNISFDGENFEVEDFPCWIYDLNRGCKEYELFDKMELNTRKMFNAYCQQEIKPKINNMISSRIPIQICFTKKRCRKCGAEGDPRLFGIQCHTEIDKRHQIKTEHYHERKFGYYHSDTSFLCHEPDLSCIQKILSTAAQTSEIVKGLIASCVGGGAIGKISRSNSVGSFYRDVTGSVTDGANLIAKEIGNRITTVGTSTTGSSTFFTAATTVTIAATAIFGTVVIVIGGYHFYVKLNEIKCKNCNKTLDTEGCIKKCEKCKKRLETRGCELRYPCCKEQTIDAIGCRSRERCNICNEVSVKLKSEGCTKYCCGCGKPCLKNPGCKSPANHDPEQVDEKIHIKHETREDDNKFCEQIEDFDLENDELLENLRLL